MNVNLNQIASKSIGNLIDFIWKKYIWKHGNVDNLNVMVQCTRIHNTFNSTQNENIKTFINLQMSYSNHNNIRPLIIPQYNIQYLFKS